jgi:hypothetical protein
MRASATASTPLLALTHHTQPQAVAAIPFLRWGVSIELAEALNQLIDRRQAAVHERRIGRQKDRQSDCQNGEFPAGHPIGDGCRRHDLQAGRCYEDRSVDQANFRIQRQALWQVASPSLLTAAHPPWKPKLLRQEMGASTHSRSRQGDRHWKSAGQGLFSASHNGQLRLDRDSLPRRTKAGTSEESARCCCLGRKLLSCYWKTATSETRNSGIKLPEQVGTRREGSLQLTSGAPPSLDAVAAADRVAEWAEAAVNDAKAEAAVNDSEAMAAQSSSRQDAERGRAEIATHGTGAACSGRESRPEQLEQFPYDQRWLQTRVGRWLQLVWYQVGSRPPGGACVPFLAGRRSWAGGDLRPYRHRPAAGNLGHITTSWRPGIDVARQALA